MSKKVAAQLEKLRGEEWDSESDSEQGADFEASDDFVHLDTQSQATELATKRAGGRNQSKMIKEKESNVIYLGRIPHGFYEDQMRGFFQQFGAIKRLRLSRNKRTGKSKHYAFIQFEDAEVAKIVADTMNNYRLFNHVLSSHLVPVSSIHERMFVGANKTFKPLPWRAMARTAHNAERTYEQTLARNKRLVKKDEQKRSVLAALGIDYEFPGYGARAPAKQQHIVFSS